MYKRGEKIFDKFIPGETITYRDKLKQLVEQKLSGHQISKELNIHYTTVHRWLRKLNLNLYNYHNELKFNNTVFDIIDTEEKAYWLGFLYADGYVSKNGVTVSLDLMRDDTEHLEKFRRFLNNKNPIIIGKVKCNNKEFERCRLTMTNKHFNESLVKLGCIPNKSLILTFPDKSLFKSEELIHHFIRGYVDGDGSVYKSNYANFSIIGTKEFLKGIKDNCPNLFSELYHKDNRHPDSNTYFMDNSGKKATLFGEYLYNNATIYLQRKYNKFIENKYDETEHIRRMLNHSEKQQLYYSRATNRIRKNRSIN